MQTDVAVPAAKKEDLGDCFPTRVQKTNASTRSSPMHLMKSTTKRILALTRELKRKLQPCVLLIFAVTVVRLEIFAPLKNISHSQIYKGIPELQ